MILMGLNFLLLIELMEPYTAVVVQTESWYDTYGTQFFAVDRVNGTIYAIKNDGQWKPTKEKATIDMNEYPSYIYVNYSFGRKSN